MWVHIPGQALDLPERVPLKRPEFNARYGPAAQRFSFGGRLLADWAGGWSMFLTRSWFGQLLEHRLESRAALDDWLKACKSDMAICAVDFAADLKATCVHVPQLSIAAWVRAMRVAAGRREAQTLRIKSVVQLRGSLWATPMARDHRSGKESESTYMKNTRPLSSQVTRWALDVLDFDPRKPVRINPAFVEGLLGLPVGFTDHRASLAGGAEEVA